MKVLIDSFHIRYFYSLAPRLYKGVLVDNFEKPNNDTDTLYKSLVVKRLPSTFQSVVCSAIPT